MQDLGCSCVIDGTPYRVSICSCAASFSTQRLYTSIFTVATVNCLLSLSRAATCRSSSTTWRRSRVTSILSDNDAPSIRAHSRSIFRCRSALVSHANACRRRSIWTKTIGTIHRPMTSHFSAQHGTPTLDVRLQTLLQTRECFEVVARSQPARCFLLCTIAAVNDGRAGTGERTSRTGSRSLIHKPTTVTRHKTQVTQISGVRHRTSDSSTATSSIPKLEPTPTVCLCVGIRHALQLNESNVDATR